MNVSFAYLFVGVSVMFLCFPIVGSAERQEAPYGYWESPITADFIVEDGIALGTIQVDGEEIYWSEMRPKEGGRTTLMRRNAAGEIEELLPAPYNARTRVHEYGGASYVVWEGILYFSHFDDQRVYEMRDAVTRPLTEEGVRFADMIATASDLIAVAERQEEEGVENFLAVIDRYDGSFHQIAAGHDFYSHPTLSPQGDQLAWICWDRPNMPWDGTELWVADFDGRALTNPRRVAGGIDISVAQPRWSEQGELYYISDETGWWNLYRRREESAENLTPMEAEFALPQWLLGRSTWAFAGERIICAYIQEGVSHLALLDPETKAFERLPLDYTSYDQVRAGPGFAVFNAGSPKEKEALIYLDIEAMKPEVVRRSQETEVDEEYLSFAEAISYPSGEGRVAHAFYYPPCNKDYQAPEGTLPPLLVKTHGGPTAAVNNTLSMGIQYWTSRGFAVLDVNYGGSTGYGRAYRELLKGKWGIIDVEDCSYGAQHLADRGLVDPEKKIIHGGSAGGYTTLAALAFTDTFQTGGSHYGVSDLELLAKETHKFESRYLEQLIGAYPQNKSLYHERSPLYHADQIHVPVIFFQGDEDVIVPPSQAEHMVSLLKDQGVPVEYVLYEKEQHGFRNAANIKDSLERELHFYLSIFETSL